MTSTAMLQALKAVRKENTAVREALRLRTERLEREQNVSKKPGPLKSALANSSKKG